MASRRNSRAFLQPVRHCEQRRRWALHEEEEDRRAL